LMALQKKWQPSKSRNEQRAKHHTHGILPSFFFTFLGVPSALETICGVSSCGAAKNP
jgi:hypothetical protein